MLLNEICDPHFAGSITKRVLNIERVALHASVVQISQSEGLLVLAEDFIDMEIEEDEGFDGVWRDWECDV